MAANPMTWWRPPVRLSVLASAVAAVGVTLAGCTNVTPLGPGAAPVRLPPARHLGAPIIVQILRSQSPTPTGACPTGSVDLFGLEPNVPRVSVASGAPAPVQGNTAPPTPTPPATPPVGVACYRPLGTPVTVTSAAVSSVATYQYQAGPAAYGFVIAFPAADVPALTAVVQRAQDAGDATSISVGGKLWQAPQPRVKVIALRAVQITLLSKTQAFELYRLLVPPG